MSAESAAKDADDIFQTFARQNVRAWRRLAMTVGISVALHAGLIALRAGDLAFPTQHHAPQESRAKGAPAPLSVRLSARKLMLARADATGRLRISPPPAQAPVVMTDTQGTGGWSTKDEPDPQRPQPPSRMGAPAPVYFSAAELSRRPEPVEELDANPQEIENQSGSGKVVLNLYISESGRMDRVDVESTTAGEALATGIAEEFRHMRFLPAEIDGTPVKSRLRIEVLVRPLLRP